MQTQSDLKLDNLDIPDSVLRKKLRTAQAIRSALSNQDSLLDEIQAAASLGLTARTLQAWRQNGSGPRFVRVSARCIRYRKADLTAWIESRLARSTAE